MKNMFGLNKKLFLFFLLSILILLVLTTKFSVSVESNNTTNDNITNNNTTTNNINNTITNTTTTNNTTTNDTINNTGNTQDNTHDIIINGFLLCNSTINYELNISFKNKRTNESKVVNAYFDEPNWAYSAHIEGVEEGDILEIIINDKHYSIQEEMTITADMLDNNVSKNLSLEFQNNPPNTSFNCVINTIEGERVDLLTELINLGLEDVDNDDLTITPNIIRFDYSSSGEHERGIIVSDGFVNQTINCSFNVENKALIGAESLRAQQNLELKDWNNNELDDKVNGTKGVLLENNNLSIKFRFNFNNVLNLTRVSVKQGVYNNHTFVIINGLVGFEGKKSVIFKSIINNTNNTNNHSMVCVKDEEISNVSEISEGCNQSNEFVLVCEATNKTKEELRSMNLSDERKCFFNNNTRYYLITGLEHSGIEEGCFSNWSCTAWSDCEDGQQQRTCVDLNNCSSDRVETRSCDCDEDWVCGDWSDCVNGKHHRTCYDDTGCNSTNLYQEESCECVPDYSDCSSWSVCSHGKQTRICSDTKCGQGSIVETRSCGSNESTNEIKNNETTNENNNNTRSNNINNNDESLLVPELENIGWEEDDEDNNENVKALVTGKATSRGGKKSRNSITGYSILGFGTKPVVSLLPFFIIIIIVLGLVVSKNPELKRRIRLKVNDFKRNLRINKSNRNNKNSREVLSDWKPRRLELETARDKEKVVSEKEKREKEQRRIAITEGIKKIIQKRIKREVKTIGKENKKEEGNLRGKEDKKEEGTIKKEEGKKEGKEKEKRDDRISGDYDRRLEF